MSDEKPAELSDLDWLMSMDPLLYEKIHIDAIIAYQRNHRANVEKGIKPKKDSGPKLTLDSLLDRVKPKAEPVKRRL